MFRDAFQRNRLKFGIAVSVIYLSIYATVAIGHCHLVALSCTLAVRHLQTHSCTPHTFQTQRKVLQLLAGNCRTKSGVLAQWSCRRDSFRAPQVLFHCAGKDGVSCGHKQKCGLTFVQECLSVGSPAILILLHYVSLCWYLKKNSLLHLCFCIAKTAWRSFGWGDKKGGGSSFCCYVMSRVFIGTLRPLKAKINLNYVHKEPARTAQ